MKIKITFKDPDAVDPDDIVDEAMREMKDFELSDEERVLVAKRRAEIAQATIAKWLEYGEYVTILFDTVAETATVIASE